MIKSASFDAKASYFVALFLIIFFVAFEVKAEEEFPNLTGEVYSEARLGFVNSESGVGDYKTGVVANIEPKFSLNINEEWSAKTSWKIAPFKDRKDPNYPIKNTFPSENEPNDFGDYGLAIEELKGDFRNEDMNFFFGKYNPTFGQAWEDKRRIGVFARDFTEDYELKEKIGLGVAALLDNGGAVTFNSFFNDTTSLSNTALNKRGKNKSSDNYAGNNTNLSSYSITASGDKFLNVEDLHYNFGYRDLDVENKPGFGNEKGLVAGFEYLVPLNYNTYFVPFIEIAKINNFYGIEGQDILYTTIALTLKYSNWQAGISNITRNIDRSGNPDSNDRQTQYFVGYKFKNGIALDVAHMDVKESGGQAKIIGVSTSYTYKF